MNEKQRKPCKIEENSPKKKEMPLKVIGDLFLSID